MKMQNRAILLLLLFSLLCGAFGCAESEVVDDEVARVSMANSRMSAPMISNTTINAFCEDAFGYIWIATERGLNKYNGREFVQYYRSYGDTISGLRSSRITSLFSDSEHRMWIGTVNGVNALRDNDSFDSYHVEAVDRSVRKIFEVGKQIYAVCGLSLCRLDVEKGFFAEVASSSSSSSSSSYIDYVPTNDGYIWRINPDVVELLECRDFSVIATYQLDYAPTGSYIDGQNNLWLLAPQGLQIINPLLPDLLALPDVLAQAEATHTEGLRAIYTYSEEELIFVTNSNEVLLYNFVLDRLIAADHRTFPFAVPDFWRINTIFVDSHANVWIGSREEGFYTFSALERSFVSNIQLQKLFENRSVVDMSTDAAGNLWILARPNYLVFYNTTTRRITQVSLEHLFTGVEGVNENLVYSIFVDSSDNIWVNIDWRLVKCHYTNDRLVLLDEYGFEDVIDMKLAEDHRGGIWAGGTSGDLFYKSADHNTFERIPLLSDMVTSLSAITTLSNGNIVAAYRGVPIKLIEPEHRIIKDMADINPETSNMVITCFYEDYERNLWIGTNGNGYYRYNISSGRMEHRLMASASYVTSITEDLYGNSWIATLDYVSKYDRTLDSLSTRAVDYTLDGLGGEQFNYGASATLPDGVIAFGATNGLTFFNPLDLSVSVAAVPMFIESLTVNNQTVRAYAANEVIDRDILFLPRVVLRHDQTDISIGFGALDYTRRLPIGYQYYMEGVDSGWTRTDRDGRGRAYYSKLPSGRHTFRVRLLIGDTIYPDSEQALTIVVRRHPLSSIFAWVIYSLVMVALLLFVYWLIKRNNRNQIDAEVARREEAQQRHLNKMNMDFFANISHEFRTPLTMIYGAASTLSEPKEAQEGDSEKLPGIIKHNAGRMLRLVSQMLEFNKLENDALRLSVKLTDVVASTEEIIKMFSHALHQKQMELRLRNSVDDSLLMYLDGDKYEKVLCNLISNALKFSTAGGSVEVRLELASKGRLEELFGPSFGVPENEYMLVSVADTGVGIPEGNTESIFGRYFHTASHSNIGGTGIGLYFSRKLVELHHGEIKAFNRAEVEGVKGALFVFALPMNESAYSESERVGEEEKFVSVDGTRYVSEYTIDVPTDGDGGEDGKPIVLVVDDDYEVQYYLKTLLSPHYNVVTRFDAMSGYEAIEQINPAVVISDVLMLDVDGYQLCRMVKENFMMSHIPFIMLTAKATISEQVEGLDAGADAYVVKPFDPKYLLALIKSQLLNRDKIRKLVGENTSVAMLDEDLLEAQDRNFLKQLYELMERELTNPEFNINLIAKEMLISRTKLYYKVKNLTGDTPTDFFRKYKLNRALELIKAGNDRIAVVAEMVGYNSPSYFTKLFKEQFGAVPRAFLPE